MNKILSISIVLSFLFHIPNSQATVVEITGLINHDIQPSLSNADIINVDKILEAITDNTGDVTIKFPTGTYYIGKTVRHLEPETSNRNIHIDIPTGTVLKASARLVDGPIFSITHAYSNSYSNGSLCISGAGDCHYQNSALGGTIDTSEAGNSGVFSNIGAFSVGNFASNTLQGLNIIGHSSIDYSNELNRASDTAIEGAGKFITIRFNKISGYLDAGVYVSGKEINGVEISEEINIQNNEFNNTNSAVVIKRGFKKALVRWNTFQYNTADIAASTVGPEGNTPFNAYPGREIIAFGNTSRNVRGLFFASQWGKAHQKNDGSGHYRPSHYIHNNTIIDAFKKGESCSPVHAGALFRLFNTELAHIANNTISTCSQSSKVFAVITKEIEYGGVPNSAHSRCNSITNNNVIKADNIIYEGSPQPVGQSGYSSHANWYTNNTVNTDGSDVFISGGQWSGDKGTTTVIRNGITQCVRSQSTGVINNHWWTGYGTLLNEEFVSNGACPKTTQIYPCDHYKITRP